MFVLDGAEENVYNENTGCSYYNDDETGLYYLNARYYSPMWRRFLSPATSTISSSVVNGLNAYIYANNNPISIAYNSANTASTTDCRMVSPIVDSFVASYPRARPNAINIFRGLRWPQFTTKDIAKDISVSLGEVWGRVVWGFTREGRTFSEIHSLLEGINGYTVFDNLPSITGMVFKGIGIGMMGLDVVEAGINSYKSGHSFVQGAVNVLLTLGKNFLAYYATTAIGTSVGMWTGAKLGASLGAYAGPVGFAIGALIGAGVGILIDAFGDVVIDWVVGWFD